MRSGGINWMAVIVAAIAIYAIGFVVYGLMVPEEVWMAWTGMTDSEREVAMGRMPFSPLMPILTAAFLALLFKWGQVATAARGVQWGAVVALASAVPAMLHGWVYGGVPTEMTLVDSAHLFAGHVAAGAVLGAWR